MSTDRRVEADRQTYSLFRESSNVALQTSTDLNSLKVVMVRRLAAQEHSAAHVQLASCISAIMKFSVGADDDPFVKVKVQTASASQEQTSCMNLTMRLDRIGAAVLNSLPVAARLFTTMQQTVFGSTSGSVWTRTRFRLSCSEEYAEVINICSLVQEEMKEREDPSRASQQ